MKLAKRLHTFAIAGALLAVTAASGRADVIYSFTGTGPAWLSFPTEPVAFQLTVPDFINLPVDTHLLTFTCAQLDSETNCHSVPYGVSFKNVSGIPDLNFVWGLASQIGFAAVDNVEYFFYFPIGAFDAPGVYNTDLFPISAPGSLTVTVTPDTNSQTAGIDLDLDPPPPTFTPEPNMAPIALGAICFLGLYRLWHKRSAAARSVQSR